VLRRLAHRCSEIIDSIDLWVMPSMNPDGYQRFERANGNGYDLNRNFPDTYDGLAENAVQERVRLALPLWAPSACAIRADCLMSGRHGWKETL
jgi:carboxypeptidase D